MIRAMVREFAENSGTVVLTTHYMQEAEELCDRILVIKEGRRLTEGTPTAVRQGLDGGQVLEVTFPDFGDRRKEALLANGDVRVLDVRPDGVLVRVTARVAGNVLNEDLLGSLEYACKVAGSKLLVVLGHTSCGAVKGALDGVEMGSLTQLLAKMKPAIDATTGVPGERSSKNKKLVDAVARTNVGITIENIRRDSPILLELEASGKLLIVGALYDVRTGLVEFLE